MNPKLKVALVVLGLLLLGVAVWAGLAYLEYDKDKQARSYVRNYTETAAAPVDTVEATGDVAVAEPAPADIAVAKAEVQKHDTNPWWYFFLGYMLHSAVNEPTTIRTTYHSSPQYQADVEAARLEIEARQLQDAIDRAEREAQWGAEDTTWRSDNSGSWGNDDWSSDDSGSWGSDSSWDSYDSGSWGSDSSYDSGSWGDSGGWDSGSSGSWGD